MALTAVIFAFHDQIYMVQGAVQKIGATSVTSGPPEHGPPNQGTPLPPAELVRRIEQQLPGFALRSLSYETNPEEGPHGHIQGRDPRYGLRGPTYGLGEVDTVTGAITERDYLPGVQDGWFATITSFFALHFGSFGGAPVRWAYFLLGLAGAFLFYSGNLLWIESRRRKERKAGAAEQTRATRVLGALTVGVPLGCITGISLTLAAAKWLPADLANAAAWHSRIYYLVFLLVIIWGLLRGAARSGYELLWLAAGATALIPVTSLLGELVGGWNHAGAAVLVDIVAAAGALCFIVMAGAARRRAMHGPRDSIWSASRYVQAHPA